MVAATVQQGGKTIGANVTYKSIDHETFAQAANTLTYKGEDYIADIKAAARKVGVAWVK